MGFVPVQDMLNRIYNAVTKAIGVEIKAGLPAGTNKVGSVDIASGLPAGTNNIGDVDIASALPAGSNKIGSVDVNNFPATQDVQVKGRNIEVVQEGTATTDAGEGLAFDIEYLGLLSNDSITESLLFCFDNTNWKTLKPGEFISNIPVSATLLYVKTLANTALFRAWGWK